MYKIKGFTTKGKTPQDIAKEVSKAGCKEYKLPIETNTDLNVDDNPFTGTGMTADGYDKKPLKIKKKKIMTSLKMIKEQLLKGKFQTQPNDKVVKPSLK